MYKSIRRREMIKNVVYISLILLVAVVSTYLIYDKFVEERKINSSSEMLEVTYRDNSGDKIAITKVTPLTDSVGLSTTNYGLTLSNNLTEKVNYIIKVKDDIETTLDDECEEYQISKDDIRISVKAGKKETEIYTLSKLIDGILIEDSIKALEKEEVSIRIWVSQNSTLPLGSNIHYHGILEVEDYIPVGVMAASEEGEYDEY